jgi:DNA-directed RNA polymerase beta subunit
VNKQLIQYYNDAKFFYDDIYKTCKKIINSGSKNIDREINRWMRRAINYLDENMIWAWNDNNISNMMVEILIRKKEEIKIGRKLTGRHGTYNAMPVKNFVNWRELA